MSGVSHDVPCRGDLDGAGGAKVGTDQGVLGCSMWRVPWRTAEAAVGCGLKGPRVLWMGGALAKAGTAQASSGAPYRV